MRIAVIVPSLNEAEKIAACLASIREALPKAICIVVDGGSDDDTLTIAENTENVYCFAYGGSRAAAMNFAACDVDADVLLFLHGDTRIDARAGALIDEVMKDPDVIGGSFHLGFDRDHPALRFYAWGSRLNVALTSYGDQGLFVRREAFEKMGGFSDWPFLEDLDMQLRLRRKGRMVKLPIPALTSSRRYLRYGFIRQQMRNTLLVLAFMLGVSPAQLARFYSYRHSAHS